MDKRLRLGLLLDWYGALLTDRQRATLEQSLNEDCSLAEIAEREGVSRQAVRDAILRGEDQLEQYEAKAWLPCKGHGADSKHKRNAQEQRGRRYAKGFGCPY